MVKGRIHIRTCSTITSHLDNISSAHPNWTLRWDQFHGDVPVNCGWLLYSSKKLNSIAIQTQLTALAQTGLAVGIPFICLWRQVEGPGRYTLLCLCTCYCHLHLTPLPIQCSPNPSNNFLTYQTAPVSHQIPISAHHDLPLPSFPWSFWPIICQKTAGTRRLPIKWRVSPHHRPFAPYASYPQYQQNPWRCISQLPWPVPWHTISSTQHRNWPCRSFSPLFLHPLLSYQLPRIIHRDSLSYSSADAPFYQIYQCLERLNLITIVCK